MSVGASVCVGWMTGRHGWSREHPVVYLVGLVGGVGGGMAGGFTELSLVGGWTPPSFFVCSKNAAHTTLPRCTHLHNHILLPPPN